jgi:hypothetical protein
VLASFGLYARERFMAVYVLVYDRVYPLLEIKVYFIVGVPYVWSAPWDRSGVWGIRLAQ